jgi:hypothetical protein
MNLDRVVVWMSPTAPYQKAYVFQEGVLVDQAGVTVEDLEEVIYAFLIKYNINHLHFSGVHSFAEALGDKILTVGAVEYGLNDLVIKYV